MNILRQDFRSIGEIHFILDNVSIKLKYTGINKILEYLLLGCCYLSCMKHDDWWCECVFNLPIFWEGYGHYTTTCTQCNNATCVIRGQLKRLPAYKGVIFILNAINILSIASHTSCLQLSCFVVLKCTSPCTLASSIKCLPFLTTPCFP